MVKELEEILNKPSLIQRIARSSFGKTLLAAGLALVMYACEKEVPECPKCEPQIVEKEVEKIVEKCPTLPEPPKAMTGSVKFSPEHIYPDDKVKVTGEVYFLGDANIKVESLHYKICNPNNECLIRVAEINPPEERSTVDAKAKASEPQIQAGATVETKVQQADTTTKPQLQAGSTPQQPVRTKFAALMPLSPIKNKCQCEFNSWYLSQTYSFELIVNGKFASYTDRFDVMGGQRYAPNDFFTPDNKDLISTGEWEPGKRKAALTQGDNLRFSWGGICVYSSLEMTPSTYQITIDAMTDTNGETTDLSRMIVRYSDWCAGAGRAIISAKVPQEGAEYTAEIKIKKPKDNWFSISYPSDTWKTDLLVKEVWIKDTSFCK